MVVRLIGKVLSLLLFKAGLWAPLLFAAVYGSLVRFAGIPFSVTGMGVGAVIAWVLGVTASVAVYRRRRIIDDEPSRTTMRRVKRREPDVKVRYDYDAERISADGSNSDAMSPVRDSAERDDFSQAERDSFRKKYDLLPYDSPSSDRADGYASKSGGCGEKEDYGSKAYGNAADGYASAPSDGVSPETAAYAKAKPDAEEIFRNERERLWARLESGRRQPEVEREKEKEEERPYAYASRTDPNLYIYEYADRLEYYRRMGDEMILTSTEYKTEGKNSALR